MVYDLIKISALPAATPDESQEIVVGVGDLAKRINYGDVKADMVGTSPTYTTDTEPYLMRRTAHVGVVGKCALNKLVGGSLGWNQLVANGNFESTSSWTARQSTISVANNTANVTPSSNGTERGLQSANYLKATAGHKYIIKVDVNSPITSNVNLSFGGANAIARAVTASAWVAASCVYEATVTATTALYALIAGTTTTSQTIQYRNAMSTDLTLDFGSTIADYVYGLEQATAGAGVAWLSRYIDLGTYHAYDAGSIQSVQATAHVTTGKNLIDQTQFVQGSITGSGVDSAVTIRLRSPFVKVLPNTQYSLSVNSEVLLFEIHQYDANKNWLGYLAVNATSYTFTTRSDAEYFKLLIRYSNNATIVVSALTALQMEFGSTATTYEPYTEHVYSLGSDTLRGIPQLVSNKLQFDGDIKTPDGTITRKYGTVDLGTLTWTKAGNTFYVDVSGWAKLPESASVKIKAVCAKYTIEHYLSSSEQSAYDKVLYGSWESAGTKAIFVLDSSYSSATAAAFKTAMNGVYLVYELATPTTESSTSYQKVQTIDADGTESFTASSPVPVGHETQTPDNILAALGWLGE